METFPIFHAVKLSLLQSDRFLFFKELASEDYNFKRWDWYIMWSGLDPSKIFPDNYELKEIFNNIRKRLNHHQEVEHINEHP